MSKRKTQTQSLYQVKALKSEYVVESFTDKNALNRWLECRPQRFAVRIIESKITQRELELNMDTYQVA